jgi:hypothetical protein
MADGSNPSKFDERLDRAAKIAGLLFPLVVAVVGGVYTYRKDVNDGLVRDAQMKRDESQRNWENIQKQYSNLTALLPLLTSQNASAVTTGLDIYTSEANAGQAPLDLRATIARILAEQPGQAGAASIALDAAKAQMSRACQHDPDGLYIQVANSAEQLVKGRQLANALKSSGQAMAVQGVQRVDAVPQRTQLRYYFTDKNKTQAAKILAELAKRGFSTIDQQDLSPRYLKQGCAPPGVFELWVGGDWSPENL